jgi:hypothetical protein
VYVWACEILAAGIILTFSFKLQFWVLKLLLIALFAIAFDIIGSVRMPTGVRITLEHALLLATGMAHVVQIGLGPSALASELVRAVDPQLGHFELFVQFVVAVLAKSFSSTFRIKVTTVICILQRWILINLLFVSDIQILTEHVRVNFHEVFEIYPLLVLVVRILDQEAELNFVTFLLK